MNIWIYHSEGSDEGGSIVSYGSYYFDPSKLTEEQKNKLISGKYIHWQEREEYKLAEVAEKDIMKKPICIEKIIKPYTEQEKMEEEMYENDKEKWKIKYGSMLEPTLENSGKELELTPEEEANIEKLAAAIHQQQLRFIAAAEIHEFVKY